MWRTLWSMALEVEVKPQHKQHCWKGGPINNWVFSCLECVIKICIFFPPNEFLRNKWLFLANESLPASYHFQLSAVPMNAVWPTILLGYSGSNLKFCFGNPRKGDQANWLVQPKSSQTAFEVDHTIQVQGSISLHSRTNLHWFSFCLCLHPS